MTIQKKTFLASSIKAAIYGTTALMTSAGAFYAHGQTTEDETKIEESADAAPQPSDDPTEVILVQGIRKSFQTAQELKRNADTFVDAIVAADAGALPDRSVSEALQRVPGVNVIRFAGANDPNRFSVEGSGVVIRGLPFVRSELNGRDVFGASPGGTLGFEDVSPELLGSVRVFKNQSADLIEGGLAGTIDLRTRLPFDSDKRVFAFSAEGNYSDLADETTPTFSALFSDNWETDIGRIGFLANVSFNELSSRADGTQIFDYDPVDIDGETFFIPGGAGIRQQFFDRERFGISAAAQWESTDRRWLASIQYLRSDASLEQNEFNLTSDVPGGLASQGQNRANFDRSDFEFDDGNVFVSGTITDTTVWRGPNATAALLPPQSQGGQVTAERVSRFSDDFTEDLSLGIKFSPNDSLRFNFEAQYLDSDAQLNDLRVFTSTFAAVRVGPEVNDVPEISFVVPEGESEDYFQDPSNYFARALLDHTVDNEADSYSLRGDVEYDFQSDGWLRSIRTGLRYNEQETTIRQSDFNWGNISEVWTGRDIQGFATNFNETQSILLLEGNPNPELDALTAGLFTPTGFNDFQRGTDTIGAIPFFSGPLGEDFNGYQTLFNNFGNALPGGFNGASASAGGSFVPLTSRTLDTDPTRFETVLPGTPFLLSETGQVERDTFAAYVRLDYSIDEIISPDIYLDGNFGIRYVRTERTVDTFLLTPNFDAVFTNVAQCDLTSEQIEEQLQTNPDFSLPAVCGLDIPSLQQALNGEIVSDTVDLDYDFWLPSFNAKLGIGDDHLVRFAVSRTLSRPGVLQLNERIRIGTLPNTNNGPGVPQNFGGFAGFQTGNADLLPQTSTNFDLSWEWYFNDTGSITLSGFYKEIGNPIIAGSELVDTPSGLSVFRPTQVTSDDDAELKGFEVAYKQFYDFLPGFWSGFGVQFNYTYIDAEVPPPEIPDILNGSGPTTFTDDPVIARFENDQDIFPRVSEHNINAIGLYERGKIQGRLAYNWRSDFLLTPRNVIDPFASVFQPATGQLDASIFYQLTDKVKVGVQGVNLTDDITRTEDSLSENGERGTASFFRNDRRFTFIVRGTF